MILAMLSGGLDSVTMVYLLLKQGHKLHIHHVEIENEEHRALAETVAVNNVLEYFKQNNLTNFTFTTSKITCPTINGNFLYDATVTNLFAGFICSNEKKIKSVAIGATKEDSQFSNTTRFSQGRQILEMFTTAEKIYPIKEFTKRELYDMLPDELKNLFWSCRTPKYENNYAIKCDRCFTCGQMKKLEILQKDLFLG